MFLNIVCIHVCCEEIVSACEFASLGLEVVGSCPTQAVGIELGSSVRVARALLSAEPCPQPAVPRYYQTVAALATGFE